MPSRGERSLIRLAKGGGARVGVYDYSTTNSSTLTIWTYGTNGIPYCDSLASSSWSGFYRC